MSSSCHQLEEIKTLISSKSTPNKSFGYSSLLHFQEQSNSNPSSIQVLAESSRCLIGSIVADIFDDDEEIAAQALKCLGFMIYHPSIVATILVDDAGLIFQSLTKLIMGTKMKSVCNLGVWCISIQQLDASFLAVHFHLLLRAVVHALENPIGSLSTTFEAIQAVMKLATQLREKMRELSHIWAPSICRRLLSIDKKERDMSERCLLKIKSIIFPPTLALSKALIEDMKQKLLSGMKDLINQGMKIQTIQAWGWFIRFLGSHAMKKNRHLINDMLKILELTFPDHNPQVQIASLVAWEGLIENLIHLPILPYETNTAMDSGIQKVRTPRGNAHDIQENGFLKSIKLIMKPLVGVISSKCDVSVRSSCLNTWCYLLHKLDTSINCPSVMKLVLNPILESVFQIGPDSKNIWLWNLCVELLDDFILAKCKVVDCDRNGQVTHQLSTTPSMLGPSISSKYSWRQYPIKWLPWDFSQLDFFIHIIIIITRHVSVVEVSSEDRNLAFDAAIRIFRSVLKGVQMEFRNMSIEFKDIMLCLNSVLRFVKKICEYLYSEGNNGMHHASLLFVEVVTEELEPSILGSPLYKVALDLKYIENLLSSNDIKLAKVLGISDITYMDMVSPVVYLSVLYICVLVKSTLNTPNMEFVLQRSHKYFKFIFSSYDPLEVLHFSISLLYKDIRYRYLHIWMAITKGLKDWIDSVKDVSLLNMESDSTSYHAICHLLSYPFFICTSLSQNSTMIRSSLEDSVVPPRRKLELEHVTDVWKSLYGSVSISKLECPTRNSFPEDLCSILNGCLDDYTSMLECSNEIDSSYTELDLNLLSISCEVVMCVLEHAVTSDVNSGSTKSQGGHYRIFSGINNIVGFAARFMKLSWMKIRAEPPIGLVISRVFSALARFASCLDLQQHILSFMEILSCPLLQWLSLVEKIKDQPTKYQLQLLWTETLNSLLRSQPPIIFNSSFLKLQACLLEKTLDHPNSSISEPTINFWNSTYGKQLVLEYPQNLLHVLDKLSRNVRINLCMRSQPFLKRCHSAIRDISTPQKYKVTATHNRSSKRIELMEATVNRSNPRRKKLELTEHQKEVRWAQQGRDGDCSGHGPGIRTYTSLDFSQGNDDSQESQDTRNPEAILEMLRRVA
ncbi:hypothetical protein LWI28_026782 [Acer negundo]|uniref:Telomere-associated protein Rif1 N-terminal domain-containing protein n=1 Tax=Acer negundo TaxID=4023 RepID=A0AAD5JHF7_ACENE|nr:hypothetical protein LWI28_026782 [Acer negundo]KAK4854534.1 hypothetical protein QYF36_025525 [Acer negundo]